MRDQFAKGLLLGWLTGSAIASSSNQQPLGSRRSPFTQEFAERVNSTLQRWHVPGVAIGVVDGEDTWTEGFGLASLPSTKVTSSTLFYGASTSKAFTAASLALMIQSRNYSIAPISGRSFERAPLSWRTPLSAVLGDDFVLENAWATAHLTIEDALSHRTGMPAHDKASSHYYGAGKDRHIGTAGDITRSLRYLPMNEEPRTTFQYCNLMYAVASHVIEMLTGQWLGDVLHSWLWEPLGMNGTYFDLDDALNAADHFAHGYYWNDKAEHFVEVPYMPLQEVSGAGAVVSSAKDYVKWVRFLLHEEKPLSKESHDAIKTPRSFSSSKPGPYDTPVTYALGWFVTSYKGHRLFFHSGGMHAYGAEVYLLPDINYGIVTFGNTAGSANAAELELLWHLIDEKLGVPKSQRHDWGKDYSDTIDSIESLYASAVETLYPNVTKENRLPPALPLESYTGTFYNLGYQNITLELDEAANEPGKSNSNRKLRLVAEDHEHTWPRSMVFEHVSGEYWVVYLRLLTGPGTKIMKEYAGVEFVVSPDGTTRRVRIDWRDVPRDIVDGSTWYDRVA